MAYSSEMAVSPTIRNYLKLVQRDMILAQSALGIRNTGTSASSLKIKGSRTRGAVLEGVGYWTFLFSGSGRGPGRTNFGAILDWVKARRLKFTDKRSGKVMKPKRTAFLVWRKISQEGTGIFQRPSRGVPIDQILKKHEPMLVDGVGTEIQQQYIKELNKVIVG